MEGGREVALRALRPLVGRHRRAEDARVQRRHAHGAARGERGAVVLAAGRLPARRPVQLAPREADRRAGRSFARSCPPTGARVLHLRRRQPGGPAATSTTCATRPRRRASTRAPSTSPTSAGTAGASSTSTTGPWARSSSSIRGNGWCARSSAQHLLARTPARDRAAVEDAAVEQGDPAGALGDVPGPPEPAARELRAGPLRDRLREEAALLARGRQRLDHRGRRARSRRPASTARRASSGRPTTQLPALRRQPHRDRLVDRRRASPRASASARTPRPITKNSSRFVPHYFT